jgi:hypothetical protein
MSRKQRFPGAAATTTREFRRRRRSTLRKKWRDLAAVAIVLSAASAITWFSAGAVELLSAGAVGALAMLGVVIWVIGGGSENLPWLWGIQGEEWTAEEIEKLPEEWYCKHDIERARGNWDHVLVGPPGVFLLDTKSLSGAARVADDALRAGRQVMLGQRFRADAAALRNELAQRFGAGWVQPVVVVWAEFPQKTVEENGVVYVHGAKLVEWLTSLPEKFAAPHRAALKEALRELAVANARA